MIDENHLVYNLVRLDSIVISKIFIVEVDHRKGLDMIKEEDLNLIDKIEEEAL